MRKLDFVFAILLVVVFIMIYGGRPTVEKESVPTVINGLTSVTGLIVGFNATIVGILYHDERKSAEPSQSRLMWTLYALAFPLVFIGLAYTYLVTSNLEAAVRLGLSGLVTSLVLFMNFLAFFTDHLTR